MVDIQWHSGCFEMVNINCSLLVIRWYLLTFIIALPLLCFLLPLYHSIYYQLFTKLAVFMKPDRVSEMDNDLLGELFTKNSERVDIANSFFELQQTSSVTRNVSTLPVKYRRKSQLPSRSEHIDTNAVVTVRVVIISAGRDSIVSNGQKFSPQYLTQNVARFMALISEQKLYDQVSYHLLVCSVGKRVTAEEHSVGRMVQLIRDPQLDNGITFGPFHDRLAWRYEKEKRDYSFCLQQAADGVKFVLIVEDDALPMNDSLPVISRLVTGQWTSRPGSHTVGKRFYIKLYHPIHLQGYLSLEAERLPQLVAAAVVLGSCLYLVIGWYSSTVTRDRTLTPNREAWIHCCIYCALIVLCIGRVHMQSWRKLLTPYAHYLVSNKFCCTQAILFTAETARDLAAYLDNTSCNETFHKDDALWTFSTSGYLMQPNVFEHVGVWSTVRHGFVDPHTIN